MDKIIIGLLIAAAAIAIFVYVILPLAAATLVIGAAFGLLRALSAWLGSFWQQCISKSNVNIPPTA